MPIEVSERLHELAARGKSPAIVAYNRIDGPGSSLDLREFQQALWRLPEWPDDLYADAAMAWTRGLPRTVGITIDTGTRVRALPLLPGMIGARSIDYGTEVVLPAGRVPPTRENWLVKILDTMGLSGVMLEVENLRADTHSSGLGGSATATTAVCLIANALAGKPFGSVQLVSMASRIEQDLDVSITGTQEQSNVIYGGVTDYAWFPWGIPGRADSGYGESVRTMLMPSSDFRELESRMAIFHTGKTHNSKDVNGVWLARLREPDGFALHAEKPELAYLFREGIRLRDWGQMLAAVRRYQEIRTELCPEYMLLAERMQAVAVAHGGAVFPLGAGGGGGALVFCPEPDGLETIRQELRGAESYREIHVRLRRAGHDSEHLDAF